MDQMKTVGFCLIKNVPGHNEDEVLPAIKEFYSLPDKVKMTMALKHFLQENENIY